MTVSTVSGRAHGPGSSIHLDRPQSGWVEDESRDGRNRVPAPRLVDTLIHRYHWENLGKASRPGACCLIEGKLKDIMPFLDALTYGEKIPEEAQATREQWRKEWRSSRWNRSRA